MQTPPHSWRDLAQAILRPEPEPAERQLRDLLALLPNDPVGFERAARRLPDWPSVIRRARIGGVSRVLHHAQPRGPEAPLILAGAEVRYERRAACLDEILNGLDQQGIAAAPLKGPFLAERLYAEPWLRPSADLDVMVAEGCLDRAAAVLKGLGYQAGPNERYYREQHFHLHFTRERTPPVELHFRALAAFGMVLPSEELLERSRPGRTRGGAPARVLAPEDELLHLALHAATHLFGRLSWLYDQKLLVLGSPNLDWSTLATRAHALHAGGALAFSLEVLRDRLRVPLPSPASLGLPDPSTLRFSLGRRVLSTVEELPIAWRSRTAGQLGLFALLCESPSVAGRFLGHRSGWILRKRARRAFPRVFPAHWDA